MKGKIIDGYEFIPYQHIRYSEDEMLKKSLDFYQRMDQRRSIRNFSDQPVSREIIQNILKTASTAPSGAHKQPWSFAVVSSPAIKSEIRKAAEKEEYESYHGRMNETWLEDLKPMGTNWEKPFLENAPYLIVVFKKPYELDQKGNKVNNYYVNESVGLACGFLLAAIHNAGLCALTHTPSPMNFLSKILKRLENERPYLLIPIGYPADEVYVPKLERKPINTIATFYD